MQKTLKYLVLVVTLFIVLITNVSAREQDEDTTVCDYPDLGLQIIYYKNTNAFRYLLTYGDKTYDTNYGNYTDKHNFLGIVKWGKSVDADLEMDRKLMNTIRDEHLCPTGMYVGFYSKGSLTVPSVASLTTFLDEFRTGNLNKWKEEGGAIFNIGAGRVFIVSHETYRKNYAKYEDELVLTGMNRDYIDGVVDYWQDTILGDVAGRVVGELFGQVGALAKDAYDVTFGDGLDIWAWETVDLLGIAKYKGDNISFSAECPNVVPGLLNYQKTITEYKDCKSESCKSEKKTNLNKIESSTKAHCEAILRNKLFTESEEECIASCLEIDETFNLYRIGTDLYNDYSSKEHCGFSKRLVDWIMNILRWIKYLVPVLLIVLSILDFVKAMAGEKDDELKKAQKHFTIRLIAAVLIFLMPFILEFIFDKMGFVYEGCGIFK